MSAALADLLRSGRVWQGETEARIPTESTGRNELDRILPGGGWPSGALTELLYERSGVGEVALVLPWLARLTQAGGRAALVGPPHVPYAPALAQAGVVLPRTLIVQPSTDEGRLWSAEQMLRAACFGTVLAWPGRMGERELRRLQLAAETGSSIGILFREASAAREASPAALRLRLERRDGELQVEVLKARGGRPGLRLVVNG